MNHFVLRVLTFAFAGAVLCTRLTAMELSTVQDELSLLLSLPLSSLNHDAETPPQTNRDGITDTEFSRLLQYRFISSIEDDRQGLNELHRAARYGFVEDIKRLSKKNDLHDQTKDQLTALHLASAFGHDAVVAELLTLGAQVNATTQEGLTPLHLAAMWGYYPVLARLIAAGANVNALHTTLGLPVHCAAQQGLAECVALLLETTDDSDQPDSTGWTPLLHAARTLR